MNEQITLDRLSVKQTNKNHRILFLPFKKKTNLQYKSHVQRLGRLSHRTTADW